ncbi:MAG TPA: hypothetical protein VKK06_14305 [Terriglobia bacterium]|nr:hypothetical protein [Terriglobia bacterium]
MKSKQLARFATKWSAVGISLAAFSYATYAATTFLRYGRPRRSKGSKADPVLDIFMPNYEVVDRHSVRIAVPAEVVLTAAAEVDIEKCPLIRAIFKSRELILGGKPDNTIRPCGLLAEMQSLGWRVLAEIPGREIVVGAVTQPWEPNPVFRGLAPDEFTNFKDPGYVKIIWTLRADAVASNESIFRTETRAVGTDGEARKKFRRYWSLLSPGIVAIRSVMLPAVKAEAERRWGANAA